MPEKSTAHDLAELTRRIFELGKRRDFDAVVSLWHPDYVWDLSPMGLGVYEGTAASVAS